MNGMGPLLCVVTDRRRFLSHGDDIGAGAGAAHAAARDALVAQATEAAEAGIDLLQVREPDLDDANLLRLVERLQGAVAGSRTRIVVNERADVAMAARAHGVHLRGSSYPAPRARRLLGPTAIVGRSVHAVDEARDVDRAGGVDYLIFGTVFPTMSKSAGHPIAGVEALAAAVRACRAPVLAIGGVTVENVAAVARTGAAGVAAIGLFLGARAPGAAAGRSLREAADRVRQAFADFSPR